MGQENPQVEETADCPLSHNTLPHAPAGAGLLLSISQPSLQPGGPGDQVLSNVSGGDVGPKSRLLVLYRWWDLYGQKTPEASVDSVTATISLGH